MAELLKGAGPDLSETERRILHYISRGMEIKAIATELDICTKTGPQRISGDPLEISLGSMVDLARFAVREGIPSLD